MTIALVLPNLPKYSESFFTHKIKLLQDSEFKVVVLVVGAAYEKPNLNFPVYYYQPILAASGLQRWLLSFWLILKSFITQPTRAFRLINEAKKSGYSFSGELRLIAVLSNFLKIKTNRMHFAYGTMAVERAIIGKVIGAKVGVSFRGFDICVAPLANIGLNKKVCLYMDKVHNISKDLLQEAKS